MKRRCPKCRSILRPSDRGCETCGIEVPFQSQREADKLAGETRSKGESEQRKAS